MAEQTVAAGTVPAQTPKSADELLPAVSSASDTLFWTLKARYVALKDSRGCSFNTVSDLKEMIWSLSGVPPARQKILGLVKGKLPADTELLSTLGLFESKAFTCLGTPEGQELQAAQGPGVVDDLDVDFQTALLRNPALDDRNKRRVEEAAAKLSLNIMNPPREGKGLLVLDIDYTILDCSAWSDETIHPLDMARPHLDAFLTAVYPNWDIVIWSQTSWKWLESKLIEMKLVGHEHDRFHISFVLDRIPMIKVQSMREGQPYTHEVKALAIIWAKYAQYGPHNSLHIDDLGRNFVMNPGNGIKCRAFKDARKHRDDKELLYLINYLEMMQTEKDVSKIDHSHWRKREGVRGPK